MLNTKTVLTGEGSSTRWYNLQADLPVPLLRSSIRDHAAHRPGRSGHLCFRWGSSRRGEPRQMDRDPRAGPGHLSLVAATPLYRAHGWSKRSRHPPAYTTNGRCESRGSHKPNTGRTGKPITNQCEGVKRLTRRRGPGSGGVPWPGLPAVRSGVQSLHGQDQLPAQALPEADDGGLGANVVPSPSPDTHAGPSNLNEGPHLSWKPRHRYQRGG